MAWYVLNARAAMQGPHDSRASCISLMSRISTALSVSHVRPGCHLFVEAQTGCNLYQNYYI